MLVVTDTPRQTLAADVVIQLAVCSVRNAPDRGLRHPADGVAQIAVGEDLLEAAREPEQVTQHPVSPHPRLDLGLPRHDLGEQFLVGVEEKARLGEVQNECAFGLLEHGLLEGVRTHLVVRGVAGAAAGAWSVQQIDAEILKDIIPALLFCIALYTILTPSLGKAQKKAILHAEIYFLIFGLLLGFYDGFFGPGVGAFWAIAFVILLGYDLQRATGYTKVMNFVSNIVALIVFAVGGSIWYSYGLVMGIGQMFGARIGARFAVKKGVAVIRPLYIIVVIATIAKLLYSRYW